MRHRLRQRLAAALGVIILGGSLLAACDNDRRAISRDDLPEVPTEPTVSVELGDDGFDPAELEVTTVDVVEFRNVGDDDHGVRTDDFAIDSGPLRPGESTLVVFDEAGTYTVVDTEATADNDDATAGIQVEVTEPTPADP